MRFVSERRWPLCITVSPRPYEVPQMAPAPDHRRDLDTVLLVSFTNIQDTAPSRVESLRSASVGRSSPHCTQLSPHPSRGYTAVLYARLKSQMRKPKCNCKWSASRASRVSRPSAYDTASGDLAECAVPDREGTSLTHACTCGVERMWRMLDGASAAMRWEIFHYCLTNCIASSVQRTEYGRW